MQTGNRFRGFAAPEGSAEVVGKRLEAEEFQSFERAITQSLSAHESERQSRMSNAEEALLRRCPPAREAGPPNHHDDTVDSDQ